MSLILDYDRFGDKHTYVDVTGNYQFNTHDPNGDVLYGIEVFVRPDYRGLRLARRLYDARKELCESLNLKGIIAGGSIPGYAKFAEDIAPLECIEKVRLNEVYDPILSFQLANNFHVRRILNNYLEGDYQTKQYATLIEWINVYYEPK